MATSYLSQHSNYFECLRRLPEVLRPAFTKAFQDRFPLPQELSWETLIELDAEQHQDTPSLPLSHLHFLILIGRKPLDELKLFLDPGPSEIDHVLLILRAICKQAEKPSPPLPSSPVDDLLLMLPYVGALEFITGTDWYLRRIHLMEEKGETPPELRLIQEWAALRSWKEVVPLSFTTLSRRFNRFIHHVDPIPPYLLSLLPFEPNFLSWQKGLANPAQVDQALLIAKELGKVDLCLRLPPDIVDPCLTKGSLLANLIQTYRQLPPVKTDPDAREPKWLKTKFPTVPPFLLPVILQGRPLSEVLENPDLWPPTLALLQQVKFLELLTLLPPESTCEFSQNHDFFPGMPWATILEKSRAALLAEGKPPLTEELAKELLYFEADPLLDTESIIRFSYAPTQILQHARYLSFRIANETAPALELLRQEHHYLPLSAAEAELVEQTLDLVIHMDGFISAGIGAVRIGKRVKQHLEQNAFLTNRNLSAWVHGGLKSFERYSLAERQKIHLNIHKIYGAALNKISLIPSTKQIVEELREESSKRDAISKNVQLISRDLLHFLSSYPELETEEGKISITGLLDWFGKDNEQHERFFGTKSVYGYRFLKATLPTDELGEELLLDPFVSYDPGTQKYRYHLEPLLDFLSHALELFFKKHLASHQGLYSESHIQALRSTVLPHLLNSFPETQSLSRKEGGMTDDELVDAIGSVETEGIESMIRLLTVAKELQPHQIEGIRLRQERIEALKQQKATRVRDLTQGIEHAERIISENSSINPFKKFSSEQQRLHREARVERTRLVAEQQLFREQTKMARRCLQMQIEIIQKHGIPELLDIFAWYLGLPIEALS